MISASLPEIWKITSLDEIAPDISYGYTTSSTTKLTGIKLLRITDIQKNAVNWKNVPFCEIEPGRLEKYRLKSGDLVFARTGATVGKSYLINDEPPEAVYASYLIRVRCSASISVELLSHFFRSKDYWNQITDFSAGIGQPNVNGTKLKKLSVPIPPFDEQKAIADKLDTLLAQVENTKAHLECVPKILKRFRQSVLAGAVSGQLTKEWRQNSDHTEWKTVSLGDVIGEISQGWSPKCHNEPTLDRTWGVIKTGAVVLTCWWSTLTPYLNVFGGYRAAR